MEQRRVNKVYVPKNASRVEVKSASPVVEEKQEISANEGLFAPPSAEQPHPKRVLEARPQKKRENQPRQGFASEKASPSRLGGPQPKKKKPQKQLFQRRWVSFPHKVPRSGTSS